MTRPVLFLAATMLASCAGMMNSHRMMAAERKLLETRKLQQAGQWDAALDMAGRMHSSVAKAVHSAPMQKIAGAPPMDIRPLLAGWESGPFSELKTALRKHDATLSKAAFTALHQQCVNCHTVLGKTQIRLKELP